MIKTYLVETHEYNHDTGKCDLAEYFAYELQYFASTHDLYAPTHHTILALALI